MPRESGPAIDFINSLPLHGSGCLRWPFAINPQGIAKFNGRYNGQNAAAFICEKIHGPAPTPRHQASHSCGKAHEACIAPWHLRWKTTKENAQERKMHGTALIGDRNPQTKLDHVSVMEIKELLPILPIKEIARRFKVSRATIHKINTQQTWVN